MYKWLGFILVMTMACKGSTGVPSGVLGYNEMKELMWDLTQVDEFATTYLVRDSAKKLNVESLLMYQKVFAMHDVSNEAFAESYAFYKSHPLQEKVLMDSLFQYSGRQRDATPRFVPTSPLTHLLHPAPMPIGYNNWMDYQFANTVYQ